MLGRLHHLLKPTSKADKKASATPSGNQGTTILGSTIIPGKEIAALHRALTAIFLADPTAIDTAWVNAHAINVPISLTSPNRIWWRIPHRNAPGHFYISLRPGEYREDPPTGPEDEIRPVPTTADSPRLSTILANLVACTDESRIDLDNWNAAPLQLAAREIAAGNADTLAARGAKRFRDASEHIRTAGADDYQLFVNGLISESLLGFELPADRFAESMVFFQLQAMLNAWVQTSVHGSPYERPRLFLSALVREMLPTRSAQVGAKLAEIGNGCYRDAATAIRDALSTQGQRRFCQLLSLAAFYYQGAIAVRQIVEELKVPAPLVYRLMDAEEGYACLHAGASLGVTFFIESLDSTPAAISSELSQADDEAFSRVRRQLASPIWPIHSKHFGQLLIGRALTMTDGPHFGTALADLEELERATSSSFDPSEPDFEQSWLEHSLLNAYILAGDVEKTEVYALRNAARIIFTYPP